MIELRVGMRVRWQDPDIENAPSDCGTIQAILTEEEFEIRWDDGSETFSNRMDATTYMTVEQVH